LTKKYNYTGWSKEDLIKRIHELEKRKKYGLVWDEEREPEQVVLQCQKELPVLKEVKEKEIKNDPDRPTHILIEGDNYHALSVLNYTHENSVDVIYIDPPYNTGSKDWTYNNNYVDEYDSYRHSKWLSFMKNRLILSRNVLKNDGILCITIDDHEIHRLWCILEDVFGEENHLGTLVIRNNPSGRSTLKGISITHEYALLFGKSLKSKVGRLPRNEKQIKRYDQIDDKSAFEWVNFRKHGGTRAESPKMFYPFFLTANSWRIPKMKWNNTGKEWIVLEKPLDNEVIVYPVDDNEKERRWKWAYKTVLDNPNEFKVGFDRNNNLAMYLKSRLSGEGVLPLTWWDKKEYSATAYGTNLLKEIFSDIQVFSYPKSLYAVIDCIKVCSSNKNAKVLDFFAGSGTTLHATLELNEEDDGNRQCILVTNNENNICEDVTFVRASKVLNGYQKNNGELIINSNRENLRYYRTDFVPAEPTDENKEKLTLESIEMLCLRENTFDFVLEDGPIKIFRNRDRYTAILFEQSKIDKLKSIISEYEKPIHIYIFSLGDDHFANEFSDLVNRVTVKAIPAAILRVYRRIFK